MKKLLICKDVLNSDYNLLEFFIQVKTQDVKWDEAIPFNNLKYLAVTVHYERTYIYSICLRQNILFPSFCFCRSSLTEMIPLPILSSNFSNFLIVFTSSEYAKVQWFELYNGRMETIESCWCIRQHREILFWNTPYLWIRIDELKIVWSHRKLIIWWGFYLKLF